MNKSDQPRKPIGAVPVLASIAAFVLLIAGFGALAPKQPASPINVPTSVITPGAVTGNPCGYADVVGAALVDNVGLSGANLYRVSCSDGTSPLVAR